MIDFRNSVSWLDLLLPVLLTWCVCVGCGKLQQSSEASRSAPSSQKHGNELKRIAHNGLRYVEYAPGSKISVLTTPIGEGASVRLAGQAQAKVRERGILVFIDEQPSYSWQHAAKIIFVPYANPEQTKVLFSGQMIPNFVIKDADDKVIGGSWTEL
jgi:hypothetical protein